MPFSGRNCYVVHNKHNVQNYFLKKSTVSGIVNLNIQRMKSPFGDEINRWMQFVAFIEYNIRKFNKLGKDKKHQPLLNNSKNIENNS